ncbi:putative translation factor (SUA5) [Candidatus Blochmanniella floridana]|uniref:Threonylcarbamoyl-AMP synthase n=1 Tax=Blochmanniella floridana TaxID=203907 RepID=TSAC_BLOFL|nr:RecName: Full=Threonylcarbamoyl-AMP synthase; Short=TC-AMP synthase; AltName: Full=L-threonylcarbamoyladenylate synthase; AltName: Full=t(6)A37 threonylcarbamoyladenosine biosynthesis protein TsaC; AltName: Full=tRNA threonylcarbamoyladenosine biosynthesis protein TsaC [Candidatus Blochmannia floridanus]CAD83735.1 putative translation factor (SUA5) [Candidatus Blochmannia floridanus]
MSKVYTNFTVKGLTEQLNKGKVIVYPTESVFGLGCNPDNENAINTLLKIKCRSWKKGLILVAANYTQLFKYVDDRYLNSLQLSRIFSTWPGPFTWVFPARSSTPMWLTGKFSSVAIRVSNFEPIRRLCLTFGKPLVSTSANVSGYLPARTIHAVYKQLGYDFPIMNTNVLGLPNPSIIRDAITGKIIRK